LSRALLLRFPPATFLIDSSRLFCRGVSLRLFGASRFGRFPGAAFVFGLPRCLGGLPLTKLVCP